ncbi:Kinesin-like protein kif27 [Chytriomyces hyalinus]|nr:Kinesin-like protein kif27 [Chytriomyces hyalinus]
MSSTPHGFRTASQKLLPSSLSISSVGPETPGVSVCSRIPSTPCSAVPTPALGKCMSPASFTRSEARLHCCNSAFTFSEFIIHNKDVHLGCVPATLPGGKDLMSALLTDTIFTTEQVRRIGHNQNRAVPRKRHGLHGSHSLRSPSKGSSDATLARNTSFVTDDDDDDEEDSLPPLIQGRVESLSVPPEDSPCSEFIQWTRPPCAQETGSLFSAMLLKNSIHEKDSFNSKSSLMDDSSLCLPPKLTTAKSNLSIHSNISTTNSLYDFFCDSPMIESPATGIRYEYKLECASLLNSSTPRTSALHISDIPTNTQETPCTTASLLETPVLRSATMNMDAADSLQRSGPQSGSSIPSRRQRAKTETPSKRAGANVSATKKAAMKASTAAGNISGSGPPSARKKPIPSKDMKAMAVTAAALELRRKLLLGDSVASVCEAAVIEAAAAAAAATDCDEPFEVRKEQDRFDKRGTPTRVVRKSAVGKSLIQDSRRASVSSAWSQQDLVGNESRTYSLQSLESMTSVSTANDESFSTVDLLLDEDFDINDATSILPSAEDFDILTQEPFVEAAETSPKQSGPFTAEELEAFSEAVKLENGGVTASDEDVMNYVMMMMDSSDFANAAAVTDAMFADTSETVAIAMRNVDKADVSEHWKNLLKFEDVDELDDQEIDAFDTAAFQESMNVVSDADAVDGSLMLPGDSCTGIDYADFSWQDDDYESAFPEAMELVGCNNGAAEFVHCENGSGLSATLYEPAMGGVPQYQELQMRMEKFFLSHGLDSVFKRQDSNGSIAHSEVLDTCDGMSVVAGKDLMPAQDVVDDLVEVAALDEPEQLTEPEHYAQESEHASDVEAGEMEDEEQLEEQVDLTTEVFTIDEASGRKVLHCPYPSCEKSYISKPGYRKYIFGCDYAAHVKDYFKHPGGANSPNSQRSNPFSTSKTLKDMGGAGKGGGALLPTSLAETWFDRLTKFYLIPEGPFLAMWDRLVVLSALINCILISFMIAFNHFTAAAWICSYAIDSIFLLDIYIKFHVAYLQNGLWVVFSKEMALNYLHSGQFRFDVLANLPYDLIALGWIHDPQGLYVLGLTRTIKMIRGATIISFFGRQEKKLHANFGTQILKFIFYLCTLEHCVACMWFAIACPLGTAVSCKRPSWVYGSANRNSTVNIAPLLQTGADGEEWVFGLGSNYVHALYWTVVTMTTTGYGDISAKNDTERVFALTTMIIGILFYGYVSGTIASSLSNMDSRRVAYHQKMDAIRQYMNDRDMDSDMQERVLEYYDYMWERNKGIDVKNLFEDMPSTFKSEVALSLNNSIIEKASIFAGCSIGFKRKVAISMKLYLFTANEYVIHKGDLGTEMFFITQGRIDVFWTSDLQRPTASLIDGAHFGEFQTILGYKHEYSARAVCNTDIYVLSREDLDVAFNAFPDDKKLVMNATSNRYTVALNSRKSRDFGAETPTDVTSEFGQAQVPPLTSRSSSNMKLAKRRSSNGFLVKSQERILDDIQPSRQLAFKSHSLKGSKNSLNNLTMGGAASDVIIAIVESSNSELDSPPSVPELPAARMEPRISEESRGSLLQSQSTQSRSRLSSNA